MLYEKAAPRIREIINSRFPSTMVDILDSIDSALMIRDRATCQFTMEMDNDGIRIGFT